MKLEKRHPIYAENYPSVPNTFYLWKRKYGGMDQEILRQFKELERENARLKKMYADLSLDHSILKEVIEKKL